MRAPMICPYCGHRWIPRSDNPTLCCSQCNRKVKRQPPSISILGPPLEIPDICDLCGARAGALHPCRLDGEAAFVCDRCLAALRG